MSHHACLSHSCDCPVTQLSRGDLERRIDRLGALEPIEASTDRYRRAVGDELYRRYADQMRLHPSSTLVDMLQALIEPRPPTRPHLCLRQDALMAELLDRHHEARAVCELWEQDRHDRPEGPASAVITAVRQTL